MTFPTGDRNHLTPKQSAGGLAAILLFMGFGMMYLFAQAGVYDDIDTLRQDHPEKFVKYDECLEQCRIEFDDDNWKLRQCSNNCFSLKK